MEEVSEPVNIPSEGVWGATVIFIGGVLWAAWKHIQHLRQLNKAPGQVKELAQIIEEMAGWIAEDLRGKPSPLTPTENHRLGTIDKIQGVLRKMEIGNGNGR